MKTIAKLLVLSAAMTTLVLTTSPNANAKMHGARRITVKTTCTADNGSSCRCVGPCEAGATGCSCLPPAN